MQYYDITQKIVLFQLWVEVMNMEFRIKRF